MYMKMHRKKHRLHLLELVFSDSETRIAFGKVTRKSSYVVTICPELSVYNLFLQNKNSVSNLWGMSRSLTSMLKMIEGAGI